MLKASNALVLAIFLDTTLFSFVEIPLQPLAFQLNDAEEDTRLLYPQSFCESNLFIYFETLSNWMLISRLFSVIGSTGAGKSTVSLR